MKAKNEDMGIHVEKTKKISRCKRPFFFFVCVRVCVCMMASLLLRSLAKNENWGEEMKKKSGGKNGVCAFFLFFFFAFGLIRSSKNNEQK